MNYGKINNPIPSTLLTERDVLKSLLEKEEITPEYYKEQKRTLDYKIGMYIAGTNGRYTMGKLPRRYRLKNMDAMREHYTQNVMNEFREGILKELDEEPQATNNEPVIGQYSKRIQRQLAKMHKPVEAPSE